MFGIDKMLTFLLKTNSPQMFTTYNIQVLRKLSQDFRENIRSEVILVYCHNSEQPVCNLAKRKTLTPEFFGEIFKNGQLWTAASEQYEKAACNVIHIIL